MSKLPRVPEIKIRSLTGMESLTLTRGLSALIQTSPTDSTDFWAATIMLDMIPKILYQEKPE